MALDHQRGGHGLGGRVDERAGVASREEVDARVIGEEELRGVKAGGRRERAPGGAPRVVRRVRCVVRVPGDRVVPAGRPTHRAEHEHPLELRERQRFPAGAVRKGTVRQLVTQGETPRPATKKGIHEWERAERVKSLALDARARRC